MQELYKLSNSNQRVYREKVHIEADDILCHWFSILGFKDIVYIYNDIPKYYI